MKTTACVASLIGVLIITGCSGQSSERGSSNGGGTSVASAGAAGLEAGGGDGGATNVGPGGSQSNTGGTVVNVGGTSPTTTVHYVADETSIFANPERGFYHHEETHANSHTPLSTDTLTRYRTDEAISLILRLYYLESFRDSDITDSYLTAIRTDLNTVRSAGLKVILRFAYTDSTTAPYGDASRTRVTGHIAQLAPILQQNEDVILTIQAGFIGAWGEWYYTDYFGDDGQISAAQWDDRRAVVDALLSALPQFRNVALRTPAFKQRFFGSAALSSSEAFTGANKTRVGHHNDCFLSGADDQGTYSDVAADKAYLATENLFVLQGGETCAVSSYSDYAHAASDMKQLHYSYLNRDYHQGVLDSWGNDIDSPRRLLGYRLALTSGVFPTMAQRGGELPVTFVIENSGYAPPLGPREFQVLLRHETTGKLHFATLLTEPRRFAPGQTETVSSKLCVPTTLPGGTYSMLLRLPDPSPTVHEIPAYSIRLANEGLWDNSTGYHDLKHQLTISEELAVSSCGGDSVPLTP